MPVLTKYQAEGKVVAVAQETADQRNETISMGGYKLNFSFGGGRGPVPPQVQGQAALAAQASRPPQPNQGFALIINTGPDEFLLVGQGFSMTAAPETPGPKIAGFGSIDEDRYEKGMWIPGRRINGDESGGGSRGSIRGPYVGMLRIKLYRYE